MTQSDERDELAHTIAASSAWKFGAPDELADLLMNRGYRRHPVGITDDMVEAAAHVLHEEFCLTRIYKGEGDDERIVGITPWDWLSDESRDNYRKVARAALEAAGKVRHG